ncbi:MAG: FGGY family carbohydrate kinase, partial [Mycobacteriales bacterium]
MLRGPLFLGIDVGTTSVKAALVDDRLGIVATASADYPTTFVRPAWVEQDAEDWWRATIAALATLNKSAPDVLSSVAGVSVTAQAPTLLALDSSGAPLRPALIWMDRRADSESAILCTLIDSNEYQRNSGNRLDPFFVAPKLLWLKEHEPEVLRRTHTFLQVNGFIAYRLTGAISMDESHASLLGLLDVRTGGWLADVVAAIGVDPATLPISSAATDVIGHVTREAAEATGLERGTPVVAGTVDSAAAALEVGVVRLGMAAEMTGTSTVVVLPTAEPAARPEFITMRSAIPAQWLCLAAMVATGASLSWLRDVTPAGTSLTELTEAAAGVPVGADGLVFLPYMMGERSPIWDTSARGAFVGLHLGSGVPELTRAVLEGVAFALRHNLEIAAAAGFHPEALRSTGAPAASDVWCQIKADVTGVPIHRMRGPTGAAYGSAIIAAWGTGNVGEVGEILDAPGAVDREFVPDPRNAQLYGDLFHIFRN